MNRNCDKGIARICNILYSECEDQNLLNKWTQQLESIDSYDNTYAERNYAPEKRNSLKWFRLNHIIDKLIKKTDEKYTHVWEEKIENLLVNETESDWDEENSPISRTRSPSDCDEHVFSSLTLPGSPGGLQLINPNDLLNGADVEDESNQTSLGLPIPVLMRQSNLASQLELNCDEADAIPEPSGKVDISNFDLAKWNNLINIDNKIKSVEDNHALYETMIKEWGIEYCQFRADEYKEYKMMKTKFQSGNISQSDMETWELSNPYKSFNMFVEDKLAAGKIEQDPYDYWSIRYM